jgi:hypothetical protein
MERYTRQIRAWADYKIPTGAEPPWACYQYMKLEESFPVKMADVVERRHEPHRLLKARWSLVSLLDKPLSSSKLVICGTSGIP